jgi:hypothetical protein
MVFPNTAVPPSGERRRPPLCAALPSPWPHFSVPSAVFICRYSNSGRTLPGSAYGLPKPVNRRRSVPPRRPPSISASPPHTATFIRNTSTVGNSAYYAHPGPRSLHDERTQVAVWRRHILSLPLAAGLPPLQRQIGGVYSLRFTALRSGRKPVLQRHNGGGAAPGPWPGAVR